MSEIRFMNLVLSEDKFSIIIIQQKYRIGGQ